MARIKIAYHTDRIIILGDLHANWEALLLLQQVERHPLAVFCLGDTVGYGPAPKRCLDAMRATTKYVIGGWHDKALLDFENPTGLNDLLGETWAQTRAALPTADLDYLAALPTALTIELNGTRFHLTRLPPDDQTTETESLITMPTARLQEYFGQLEAEIILVGGPHIPSMRQLGEKLIVCPGSLGQPRYGIPEPTFAVWRNGKLQIHHLHYQPLATARKLAMLPLSAETNSHLQAIIMKGYAPD